MDEVIETSLNQGQPFTELLIGFALAIGIVIFIAWAFEQKK